MTYPRSRLASPREFAHRQGLVGVTCECANQASLEADWLRAELNGPIEALEVRFHEHPLIWL